MEIHSSHRRDAAASLGLAVNGFSGPSGYSGPQSKLKTDILLANGYEHSQNGKTDLEVLAAVRSRPVFSAEGGPAGDEISAAHSLPKEKRPTHGSTRGALPAARFWSVCGGTLRRSLFVGFIGLSVPTFHTAFTPCVEIGWRLSADYWGQGLATEGAAEMVRYAFEVLRLESLVSFTVPTNIRSRRVMEKLRMVHDAGDDFDHPNLPEDHPLRRHVLYR